MILQGAGDRTVGIETIKILRLSDNYEGLRVPNLVGLVPDTRLARLNGCCVILPDLGPPTVCRL